jgi:hypothetical protein
MKDPLQALISLHAEFERAPRANGQVDKSLLRTELLRLVDMPKRTAGSSTWESFTNE